MSLRTRLRRSMPWAIVVIGGFLSAYLIVAFLIFPSGLVPRDVRVPNVMGLTFDQAVQRLAERGLRGMRGEERFHPASPKGTVLEQNPRANSRDVENATVTLIVSAGQKMMRVPAIVGMTRDDAERALEEAGFDVGDVSEQVSAKPAGEVLASHPKEGTDAPSPGLVSLVLSAGRDTTRRDTTRTR